VPGVHRHLSPPFQAAISVVLVALMVSLIGAVWTGALDMERLTVRLPPRAPAADRPPVPAQPAWQPVVPRDATLWMTFDQFRRLPSGELRFADVDGRWAATERRFDDGELTSVPGPPGRGRALRGPDACPLAAGCPAAVAVVADDGALDPGGADFSYGASVLLLPDDPVGGNVLGKGRLQADGGQWTLHVDALDGRPSCVVEGRTERATQVIVRSVVTVADGAWHTVTCHKTADSVRIVVDGRVDRLDESVGTVSNDDAIAIGGSAQDPAASQFHGHIDDVFLWVDRRDS
jgi:hypothetical protein